MKKIVFIGMIGAGKTTVSEAILGKEIRYKKTQAVEVLGDFILDTPGEYLERVSMRGTLSVISADAEVIGLVVSAAEERWRLPPAYAGSFGKEVIGIITKIDIATPEEIKIAEERLKTAGVTKVFKISSVTKEGIEELKQYLSED